MQLAVCELPRRQHGQVHTSRRSNTPRRAPPQLCAGAHRRLSISRGSGRSGGALALPKDRRGNPGPGSISVAGANVPSEQCIRLHPYGPVSTCCLGPRETRSASTRSTRVPRSAPSSRTRGAVMGRVRKVMASFEGCMRELGCVCGRSRALGATASHSRPTDAPPLPQKPWRIAQKSSTG